MIMKIGRKEAALRAQREERAAAVRDTKVKVKAKAIGKVASTKASKRGRSPR
jgi:hypothetical protein